MGDPTARILADVELLASPECEGRAPGSQGGRRARQHLEERLADLDLEPAGGDGYRQPIPSIGGANLVARIPGSGPRAGRHILVAAHYDHLGRIGGEIYPGADDNASGVAVTAEVARRLAADPSGLDRSVLVAFFDSEEPPYYLSPEMGSVVYVAGGDLPPIDQMLCLDVVGHRLGGSRTPAEVGESIFVLGAERSPETVRIVDAAADGVSGLRPRRGDIGLIPPLSDYFAFERAGIPHLFLTCGRGAAYHTPSDTAATVDGAKLAGLADYLTVLTTELSTGPDAIGEYLGERFDDDATLSSLEELGRALAPDLPEAEDLVAAVEGLRARLAGGEATPGQRQQITGLLLATEEGLAELSDLDG